MGAPKRVREPARWWCGRGRRRTPPQGAARARGSGGGAGEDGAERRVIDRMARLDRARRDPVDGARPTRRRLARCHVAHSSPAQRLLPLYFQRPVLASWWLIVIGRSGTPPGGRADATFWPPSRARDLLRRPAFALFRAHHVLDAVWQDVASLRIALEPRRIGGSWRSSSSWGCSMSGAVRWGRRRAGSTAGRRRRGRGGRSEAGESGRAHRGGRRGSGLSERRRGHLRDAEVGDGGRRGTSSRSTSSLTSTFSGSKIAVDDPALVRRVEGQQHLAQHARCDLRGERADALDVADKAAAVFEQGDEVDPVRCTNPRHSTWVRELLEDFFGLVRQRPQEALDTLGAEDLDCHIWVHWAVPDASQPRRQRSDPPRPARSHHSRVLIEQITRTQDIAPPLLRPGAPAREIGQLSGVSRKVVRHLATGCRHRQSGTTAAAAASRLRYDVARRPDAP